MFKISFEYFQYSRYFRYSRRDNCISAIWMFNSLPDLKVESHWVHLKREGALCVVRRLTFSSARPLLPVPNKTSQDCLFFGLGKTLGSYIYGFSKLESSHHVMYSLLCCFYTVVMWFCWACRISGHWFSPLWARGLTKTMAIAMAL